MNERLAESFFHIEHRVLGRRLRPYSLWHAFVLDFAGSPLAGHEGELTLEEIIFALEVLSREPGVPGGRLKLPKVTWFRRMLWRGRIRRVGELRVRAQMAAYFADYLAAPNCFDAKGKPVKSHWCLYSVAVLMRHGKHTHREAWAAEVGFTRHLLLALAEAGGHDVPLISEAEQAALKEAGH